MKFTNLSKLLIKFIGGGLVNFPTRYLKEVEVEAEGGENDGGGSGNNDDELISNTKKIYASYVNGHSGEETPLYTEDNVELPDKYICVDQTAKEIYEVGSYCGLASPLYLKNRSLNDNNIIADNRNRPILYKDATIMNANILLQNFINKSSINLDDYINFSVTPI